MSKQVKVLMGLLIAGVTALIIVAKPAMAQDNNQSGCGCCKNMDGMMNRNR
ncbi:hypothetical protein [Chroococcus sp. FPU101]|uniref:hypothetical protein n=1 Tax=Chroococcus sp. FPU101 TaxID=1974212 RepID=UPI001A90C399|nr:hypothetical protein [Chroococcus sp. FPU101]